MSHSGDTSGTSCDVTFFTSSGGQARSVTTTSNLPAGISADGGKYKLSNSSSTEHLYSAYYSVVCTGAVLLGLEVSDRQTSTQGDQLCPKLHWLLKQEEDTHGFERTAAGVPDSRETSLHSPE